MPREKPLFRDVYAQTLKDLGGRPIVPTEEAAKYLNIDIRTVKKNMPYRQKIGVTVAAIANFLCEGV